MAQQFHNNLMLDHDGMMHGELGKHWDGKLLVRATDKAVIAMFNDGSWYSRVEGALPIYFISETDSQFSSDLDKLHEIDPRLEEEVTGLALAWALELAQDEGEIANSLNRR
jgi:hypothetical protein